MMNKSLFICVVCMLLLTPNLFGQRTKGFKNVTASDFYVLLNELNNEILVDARDIKAYKNIKIDESVNLERKADLISYADTLDRETPILVYCDVGSRSKQACGIFVEQGFVNVYNLKGGLFKWQANDFPVVEFLKDKRDE